jgi:bifunctional DNA-binding transcriptional regulator/antitoxin component of YhaV-PrlF toxin-antitoxin module
MQKTLIERLQVFQRIVLSGYTPMDIDTLKQDAVSTFYKSCHYGLFAFWTIRHHFPDCSMTTQTMDIKVAGNGRMILPASVRKAMGLHGDAKVILTIENDQVRLSPIGHGVSRAQALYREHARQARTTDDFLTDRKAEAVADLGRTE